MEHCECILHGEYPEVFDPDDEQAEVIIESVNGGVFIGVWGRDNNGACASIPLDVARELGRKLAAL